MSAQAYERGWDHVKLYFMIGLPTERDDDILAIADLCERTVREGRKYNRNAAAHTGVSTFVPKPLTPFQWAEQIDAEETNRRQASSTTASATTSTSSSGATTPRRPSSRAWCRVRTGARRT